MKPQNHSSEIYEWHCCGHKHSVGVTFQTIKHQPSSKPKSSQIWPETIRIHLWVCPSLEMKMSLQDWDYSLGFWRFGLGPQESEKTELWWEMTSPRCFCRWNKPGRQIWTKNWSKGTNLEISPCSQLNYFCFSVHRTVSSHGADLILFKSISWQYSSSWFVKILIIMWMTSVWMRRRCLF